MRHERSLGWTMLVRYTLVAAMLLAARTVSAQISPGPLSSAHATLDGTLSCTKCHGGGGNAGMTTRCVACHREIAWLASQNRGLHARTKQAECSSCHPDHAGREFALVKWPDGSAQRFDHARTGWTLDEKHARVACEKCHTPELRKSPAATLGPKRSTTGWVGLETTCVSCHRDVHTGALGRDCQSCHSAAGWSSVPKFDHGRTDYPLTGKHAEVACAKCHTPPASGAGDAKPAARFKPLPHADCVACHRDPHDGRLRGACTSCHVTTGFSTVNDRAFSHDRTRYPLRGRHATVACAKCHTGYPARADRPAFATCAGCHSDPHAGKATLAGSAADCASCHTVAGFRPSTFTVAQHAAGRCQSCHTDAHAGQLAARADHGACVACHTPVGWKPSTFGVREHGALRFPLTGRHAAVDCAGCHPTTRTLGKVNVALTLGEVACESCHRDPHGGKYTKATSTGAGTCADCHDTRAFHPSTIGAESHARFAFALEGAHRAAPCVACHTSMKSSTLGASLKLAPASGAPVVYTLPQTSCSGCHGTPHGSQFANRDGGACQSCHDLRGWSPASGFVHEANGGFVLGAAHARVPCARCHVVPAGASPALRPWRGVPRACESCHRAGPPKP
jgi:hypothetical protein